MNALCDSLFSIHRVLLISIVIHLYFIIFWTNKRPLREMFKEEFKKLALWMKKLGIFGIILEINVYNEDKP